MGVRDKTRDERHVHELAPLYLTFSPQSPLVHSSELEPGGASIGRRIKGSLLTEITSG